MTVETSRSRTPSQQTTSEPRPAIDQARVRDIAAGLDEREELKRKAEKKALTDEEVKREKARLEFQASFLSDVLVNAMEILCERLPNPKPITQTEKAMFSKTTTAMVEKYLPYVSTYAVEFGFGLCLIEILYPRLQKKKQ